MKKVLSLILVVVLLMSVVTGCTKPDSDDNGKGNGNGGDVAEGKITKVGLGHIASISESKDAAEGKDAVGQADVTVAAVGFDKDGKVVSVTIDTAQTKVEVDKDGKIADKDATPKSKKELKDEYGMKSLSTNVGIGKEWYEQIEALEEWMVGKTVEEIKGMKFKKNAVGYEDTPDVAELESSVTVSVSTYLEAVSEAWENAIEVKGGEKVGLGLATTIAKSKDAEEGKEAVAQMDSTMTATAFDKDSKVVGTIIDSVQISVKVDKDGKVTSDKDAEIKTKHEKKEEYGMKKTSEQAGIGKEWYEQMNAFQEWMVGKSVADITGMKVKERDAAHKHVPDVAELTSSVTITVEDYLEVVEKASKQAK